MRTTGSSLCTLRRAASGPSSASRYQAACVPSRATPTSSMNAHTRGRRARPTRPRAATPTVKSTKTGSVARALPATRSVSTNGAQLVVPRRISGRLSHRVVTRADSMNSVNGGAKRPKMSSGTIHHADTAAHPASQASPARPARRHSRTRPAGRQAASVAVALTAPMHATATTAGAASCHVSRPGRRKGRSTQGASMTGQVSEEIAPSVVSVRGESAKSSPPAMAARAGAVGSTARTSRKNPPNPTASTRNHQRRCAIQSGSGSVRRKNRPCGKR